jgi:hypothetical protein
MTPEDIALRGAVDRRRQTVPPSPPAKTATIVMSTSFRISCSLRVDSGEKGSRST